MEITTLNVKNFGFDCDKPIWSRDKFGDPRTFKLAMEAFQKSPQRIQLAEQLVQKLLTGRASGVFAFQEFDINAPAGQKAVELFQDYGYVPIYPDQEIAAGVFGNSSITMMFAKKSLQVKPLSSPAVKEWRWCVAEVEGIKIMGVHAPLHKEEDPQHNKEVKRFFEELYGYAAAYGKEKVVILGGMNVHSEKPCVYYDIFDQIRTEGAGGLGYTDLVKDGTVTYFPNGYTIDHVLVSPELKDKADVKVYSKEELQLSDHAVIVADLSV